MRELYHDKIIGHRTILEIGPFFNPLLRGEHIKYFDILSSEQMVERATDIEGGKYVNQVPYIDYVSPIGDLSIVDSTFDAVVSCHVIEHQLDFIHHLDCVNKLLNPGGKYYLIVPDHRYCFDHFNRESTIADIINNHYEKRSKHSLKSVIEHRALTTHNDPAQHWVGSHGTLSMTAERIKKAIAEYESKDYVDVHAWYFTDGSFGHIINLLDELEMIDFKLDELIHTPHKALEFFVALRKK